MKNLTLIIIAVMLSGCAGTHAVNKNYSSINFNDGISREEAKLIAKKSLMESESFGRYCFVDPAVLKWGHAYPHPNAWFIRFANKNPLATDHYLVVIDKRNGVIQYSERENIYPLTPKDYRFIFGLEAKDYTWHKPNAS